jgi:hypothetical protein
MGRFIAGSDRIFCCRIAWTITLANTALCGRSMCSSKTGSDGSGFSEAAATGHPGYHPAKHRRIQRWEHEHVLDGMQAWLDHMPDAMHIRRQTVEHVFRTMKSLQDAAPGERRNRDGPARTRL